MFLEFFGYCLCVFEVCGEFGYEGFHVLIRLSNFVRNFLGNCAINCSSVVSSVTISFLCAWRSLFSVAACNARLLLRLVIFVVSVVLASSVFSSFIMSHSISMSSLRWFLSCDTALRSSRPSSLYDTIRIQI